MSEPVRKFTTYCYQCDDVREWAIHGEEAQCQTCFLWLNMDRFDYLGDEEIIEDGLFDECED